MKISEIFSRNTKVAESISEKQYRENFSPSVFDRRTETLKDIPDVTHINNCNCRDVLTEPLTKEEQKSLRSTIPYSEGKGRSVRRKLPDSGSFMEGEPVNIADKNDEPISGTFTRPEAGRSTVTHKIIVDRFMNLMAKKDSSTLSRLTGGTTAKGLMDHFIRHIEAAGVDPNDVGISNDMYRKFKGAKAQFQKINDLQREEEPKQETKGGYYSTKNCGVCDQYRKEFNDGILHLKDKATRDIMGSNPRGDVYGPPVSQDYANESAAKLSSDITETWRNGKTFQKKDNPLAYKVQGVLNNWNAHHEEAHKISLNNLHGPDPRIPVTMDKETQERKPNVEQVYHELLNQGSGWSKKLAPEIEDPFSIEDQSTGQKKDRFAPYVEGGGETREEYKQRATQEAMQVLEEGALPITKHVGDLKPKIVYKDKNPESRALYPSEHFIRTDVGHEGEAKPIPSSLQKQVLPGSRLETTVHFPWGMAVGYEERNPKVQTNYTTFRNNVRAPLTYNPENDKRPLKIRSLKDVPGTPEIENQELMRGEESGIPRRDKFLFQQAGMMPDLTMVKVHNSNMRAYQAQPNVEETGKTKTITKSVAEEKQVPTGKAFQKTENGLIYHDVDKPAKRGYAQPIDENGNPIMGKDGKPVLQDYDSLLEYQSKKHEEHLKKTIPDTEDKSMVIDRMQRHNEWLKKWHSVNSEEITEKDPNYPELVETGKFVRHEPKIKPVYKSERTNVNRQYEVPEVAEIPSERRLSMPALDIETAKRRYDESRAKAMVKLFGSNDEEAERKLDEAHANAFREKGMAIINSPLNKRFISKKENRMPHYQFNSKEASGLIPHVLQQNAHDIANAFDHVRHTLHNQWDQLTNTGGTPSDTGRGTDAAAQLAVEGYGVGRAGLAAGDAYDKAFTLSQGPKEKLEKLRKVIRPIKTRNKSEDSTKTSSVIEELSARLSATKKKTVCTDCGAKDCKGDQECRQRQLQNIRDQQTN